MSPNPLRPLCILSLAATAIAPVLVSPTAVAAPTPAPTAAAATRTVTVGSNPAAVAVAPSLGQAFVVNDGSVSVISLLTHRRIADIGTDGYHGQDGIALVQGSTQAYITNAEQSSMVVLDTETRKVVKRIPVGRAAADVAKVDTPAGERAYVSLYRDKHLTVVDTSNGTVAGQVKLPSAAQTSTGAPGGKRLWVGSVSESKAYVVRTSTGKVTRTIDTGRSGPIGSIAFSPNKKQAWLAGRGGVLVVDAKTYKTERFIPITRLFEGSDINMGPLAFTGSGTSVLVVNSTFPDNAAAGQVAVVSARTGKVDHRVSTGTEPLGLAIDTMRRTAYVANYLDDTVTYFRTPR